MQTANKTSITVDAVVNAPVEKVWEYWTSPKYITSWCQASEDWHAPYAENNLVAGGKFKTTMAARDGSFSFDFAGTYSNVLANELIEYTLDDGRKVKIRFAPNNNTTHIEETFEAENTNSVDMQQQGWQAILNNFKNYTETH